jgi:glutaredoxin 3
MAKVEIYTSSHCPFCDKAKALLQHKGQAYEEIRIDLDAGARDAMLVRSDGRRSVPQIFIDDSGIGGCDDLYALERDGKLDALLVE